MYPEAEPVVVESQEASLALDADFDTGALLDICTGWNLLETQGIVTPMPEDLVWVQLDLDTIRHDVSTYGLIIPICHQIEAWGIDELLDKQDHVNQYETIN